MPDTSLLGVASASLASAALWLVYWFTRVPAGPRHVRAGLVFVLAGAAAVPLAIAAFGLLELSPFYERLSYPDEVPALERAVYALFAIGPVEEVAKLALVLLALRLWPRAGASPEAVALGAIAVAIGFGALEAAWFSLNHGGIDWARALLLPFTHVLFSAFWGTALAVRGPGARLAVVAGLLASILVHGVYNWVLLSSTVPSAWILPLLLGAWGFQRVALARVGAPALPRPEPA